MSVFDILYSITKNYRELKIKTTEQFMIFVYEHNGIIIEKKILWRDLNKIEKPDSALEYLLMEMHIEIKKQEFKKKRKKDGN